jgi:ribosomal protein RSM22 (predicted rRNA methylase)
LKAIEELSKKFTENRDKISDYLRDPRLVSAYTAFYLTTNAPKFGAVLEWMPQEWKTLLKDCAFVDLGAGPGTFSLAFREWIKCPAKQMIQIETSPLMREQSLKIWKGLYPDEALIQQTGSKIQAENKFLLFGHSANEMGAKLAINYIKEIGPEHILFIEPGTKDFFPVMLEIRDYLISAGFNILFPCPQSVACPMAKTTDWCHQFIQVQQSADVERISQMVKKDRKYLPLTVQAFSRSFSSSEKETERLVRVLPETKFSLEWEVCLGDHLEHYQVMKRPFDKKMLKQLDAVLAGASVSTTLDKEMEKSKRVNLIKLNKRTL